MNEPSIMNNHPMIMERKSEMEQEEFEWIKQDRDKIEGILPKLSRNLSDNANGHSEYYSYAPSFCLCINQWTAYSYR